MSVYIGYSNTRIVYVYTALYTSLYTVLYTKHILHTYLFEAEVSGDSCTLVIAPQQPDPADMRYNNTGM